MQDIFQGKTILVTGGGGSIGSEITRQLLTYAPKLVIVLDNNENNLYKLNINISNANLKTILCDFRNKKALKYIFNLYKPNIVYHAGAYKQLPILEQNPIEAITTNLLATKLLIEVSLDFSVEKFIFISTDKAVNPISVLGATKRAAEIYLEALQNEIQHKKKSNIKLIITRFGNVSGSIGSVKLLFEEQINSGGPLTVTHKDAERYFMSISEASDLVLKSSYIGQGGEIFMFDMGKQQRIMDLAHDMIQSAGHLPNETIEIKFIGLRQGEKLKEELYLGTDIIEETVYDKIKLTRFNKRHEYKWVIQKIKEIKEASKKMNSKKALEKIIELVPNYKKQ